MSHNPTQMTKLVEIERREINRMLAANRKNEKDEYDAQDPDALSDGDERGKGLLNGSVGSKTDIAITSRNMGANLYNDGNEYHL